MSVPVIKLPWLPGTWQGFACRWFVIIRNGKDHFIPHEMKHIEQQKHFGIVKYLWRYFREEGFRAAMEIEAYRVHGHDDDYIAMILEKHYKIKDPRRFF